MHRIFIGGLLVACLFGCSGLPSATPPTAQTIAPTSTSVSPTTATVATTDLPTVDAPAVAATSAPIATAAPPTPAETATVFPTPYAGPLTLTERTEFSTDCDLSSLASLPSEGVEVLAELATGDCQDGEIGLLEIDGHKLVAQAGYLNAAFTLTDVTDPTEPRIVGIWDWNTRAVSVDLKTFRQGERHFLAISLQRGRTEEGRELPCGIGIVEVTDPSAPHAVTRLDGRNTGAPEPWCSVHTLEIDTDAQGNATYFVVSDVDTFSARAVDVRDLTQPREVNVYHLHTHPHAVPDQPVLHYVHDSFISEDKVYLAHWLDGTVVLDKQAFFAGAAQEPTFIKPTEDVAPGGFRVHYTVPILDGAFLIVQDELNADNGIRLLDVRDPANLKTLWVEKNVGGVNAPHNFVLRDGVLYVAWYNDGVKLFRVDTLNPDAPTVTPLGFQEVRANKVITRENYFDGVWGVRVDECEVRGEDATCVYLSDIGGRLGILRMADGE